MSIEIEKDGIVYVHGNLIDALKVGDIDGVAHQANCYKTMGAGFALSVRNELPELYEADQNDRRAVEERFGGFSFAVINSVSPRSFGYNLYSQYKPGPFTDLEALEKALKSMASHMQLGRKEARLGLPLIGCGIGGAKWAEVSNVITESLSSVEFYVYVLDKELLKQIVKG